VFLASCNVLTRSSSVCLHWTEDSLKRESGSKVQHANIHAAKV